MKRPEAFLQPGTTIHSWIVIGLAPRDQWRNQHRHYEIRCICGALAIASSNVLRSGQIRKSCGCSHAGPRTHGLSKTAAHRTWLNMRNRVLNPNGHNWSYYGGRGIGIDPAWATSFAAWFEYVRALPNCPFDERGQRTDAGTYSLDRIDVDGDYRPGNVCWATRKEQAANRRPAISTNVELAVAALVRRYSAVEVRAALDRQGNH